MLVCYISLAFYFKGRGGYKAVELGGDEDSDEVDSSGEDSGEVDSSGEDSSEEDSSEEPEDDEKKADDS